MREVRGVDPNDFKPDVSAELGSIIQDGELVVFGLNNGLPIDEVIDALYKAGMPSDRMDTILSQLEGEAGMWN